MAPHAAECRWLAPRGLLGIPIPSDPLWDLRGTLLPVRSWERRSTGGDPTIGGRCHVCGKGLKGGLSFWNLRGGFRKPGDEGRRTRCDCIFGFHSLARARRWKEGSVRNKPIEAVKTLATRNCPNGDAFRIRNVRAGRRPFSIFRYIQGLPGVSFTPDNEGLVYFQVSRPVLPHHCVAFWLGTFAVMVHKAGFPVRSAASRYGLSRPVVHRRLLGSPITTRHYLKQKGLYGGTKENNFTHGKLRPDQTSYKRRVGRLYESRASRCSIGFSVNEVLSAGKKGRSDSFNGSKNPPRCGNWSSMGPARPAGNVLWNMCVPFIGYAMGEVLYSISLQRYVNQQKTRRTGTRPPFSPVIARSWILEEDERVRDVRSSSPTAATRCVSSYGRSRRGIWRDIERHRPFSRHRRALACARYLGLACSSFFHHSPRVACYQAFAHWFDRRQSARAQPPQSATTCRQPSSRARDEQLCISQRPDDARTPTVEGGSRPHGHPHSQRVDTLGGKQICRWVIATIPTRRPPSAAAATALRAGWDDGATGRLPIQTTRRAPSVRARIRIRPAEFVVDAGGRRSATLSTDRPDNANSSEAPTERRASYSSDSGVASSGLVSGGTTARESERTDNMPSSLRVDRGTQTESIVESCRSGGESTITNLTLDVSAVQRLEKISGSGAAASMSARLLRDYTWSDRTTTSRNSQWDIWVEFCTADKREVLPVTEGHFIAFIGWMANERRERRRKISSSSIPQYLSAVRQMKVMLTGLSVPEYPLLPHVLRGYEKWEAENFPTPSVRSGLSCSIMQRIWGLGMSSYVPQTVRDCAACVFAFCFNGVRDSSVMSIRSSNVSLTRLSMRARLSVVKGKVASGVSSVEYHRVGTITSPLDLFLRWDSLRGDHVRYFALSGDQVQWRPGCLDASLQRVLRKLDIRAPLHYKFTSHSLRIGSHTEQVLLGIPLEVRLARFGWSSTSQEMASLYFDRTLRTTAASYWFFATVGSASSVVTTPSGS